MSLRNTLVEIASKDKASKFQLYYIRALRTESPHMHTVQRETR